MSEILKENRTLYSGDDKGILSKLHLKRSPKMTNLHKELKTTLYLCPAEAQNRLRYRD